MKNAIRAAVLAAISLPSLAFAATGLTSAASTMYSGPNTAYPSIVHLAKGLTVTIYGCSLDRKWCDVDWRGDRGWLNGNALLYRDEDRRLVTIDVTRSSPVPVLGFDIQSYWDQNYRGRLFYTEQARRVSNEVGLRQ